MLYHTPCQWGSNARCQDFPPSTKALRTEHAGTKQRSDSKATTYKRRFRPWIRQRTEQIQKKSEAVKKANGQAAPPVLCERCHNFDFCDIWERLVVRSDPQNSLEYFVIEPSDGCELCTILLPTYEPGETVVLSAFNMPRRPEHRHRVRPSRRASNRAHEAIMLESTRHDTWGSPEDLPRSFYVPLDYFDSGPRFLKPQILQDPPDYESARG